ncbi:hypothetical protein F5887DRAFT_1283437 [Amanita rubescens]|nr:hypothetical protein F5887DRAFT_1283437 [Amanita rubescens]
MLFLHALLFFLFGTAVVEARNWPKPPIRKRPVANAAARAQLPPHIPPASYGYWVRCDIDDPQNPVPDNRINDVMRLHENGNGEVGLYKLPDTGQPAFPTFVRVLGGRSLEILKGRWVRFPTPEDSPESRSQLVTAEIVDRVQFTITITSFSISTQTQYLRDRINGYFYPLGGSALNQLLQFTDSGMKLWQMPREGQSHDSPLTRMANPVPAHLIGLWLPYPMRRNPRASRNRVVDARNINGRLIFGSFMLPPRIAPA